MTTSAARVAVLAPPSPHFLARIPADFARRHLVISTGDAPDHEPIATTPDASPFALFNLSVRLCKPLRITHAHPEAIAASIHAAYASASEALSHLATESAHLTLPSQSIDAALASAEHDLLHTDGKSASVRLVDLILFDAISRGISDVHIQPTRDSTLIRYRFDGALLTARVLPPAVAALVTSRLKVMGSLDIAERRAAQDGRASVRIASAPGTPPRRIDLRISILPSTFGERVVLRVLDPSRASHIVSFPALGMPRAIELAYIAQVRRASGMVLATGPTGSGKTTTLYATLAWLSQHHTAGSSQGCDLNMMTIEDPVEYDLSASSTSPIAISQTQLDPKKGMTFAAGLRHILRQDPDVIMLGEIRDEDTARIATQASLTGHLVLSTLHTNDAPSAIARLLDLRIEPFLIASAVEAVLAQRLVRTRHHACQGSGCDDCFTTGLLGRTGIFELLVVSEPLREVIAARAAASTIAHLAVSEGMTTLRDAGLALLAAQRTTFAELERVLDLGPDACAQRPHEPAPATTTRSTLTPTA